MSRLSRQAERVTLLTSLLRALSSPRCAVYKIVAFINSFAWVLMPDHLHWLFQLGESQELATVIKTFKGRSARAFARTLGKRGTQWQRAYYDRAGRRDEDLVVIARYIVANPLRVGLVKSLGDYPFWDAIWL